MLRCIFRFSLLRRGDLYYRDGRPKSHVLGVTRVAHHGRLHSNGPLKAVKVFSTKSGNGKPSDIIKDGFNDYFMITSSRPGLTKYRDILDQLSKLLSTSVADVAPRENPAIIILATPTFATWLENDPFMCGVLEAIFPPSGAVRRPKSDITALVAVVDGLPPRPHEDAGPVTEGFAFLRCDHETALPELWQLGAKITHDSQSSNPRSGIIFRMHPSSGIEGRLDIGVPLANTMFRNGRTSTMFASKWSRAGSANTFERIEKVEKKSATIYPASSNLIVPLRLAIPLEPLTPLRQIVSGLGNILRQVANAEGNAVSASQELEASIDSYLSARSLDKQTVTVWAHIIPDSAVIDDGTGDDALAAELNQTRAFWADKLDSRTRSYDGSWIRQGRGTTLHRVLSGGGGWGLKRGLLSLDPETTFSNIADTIQSFNSSSFGDDDQIEALGNIAKPGSWVQFFISYSSAALRRPVDADEIGSARPEFESDGNLSFGCVASTVDDIPQALSDPSTLRDSTNFQTLVKGHYGRFGAMSEAGIFIHTTENGVVTSSKIDVPNSKFCLAVVDREDP